MWLVKEFPLFSSSMILYLHNTCKLYSFVITLLFAEFKVLHAEYAIFRCM